jgi:hypothetical protein
MLSTQIQGIGPQTAILVAQLTQLTLLFGDIDRAAVTAGGGQRLAQALRRERKPSSKLSIIEADRGLVHVESLVGVSGPEAVQNPAQRWTKQVDQIADNALSIDGPR